MKVKFTGIFVIFFLLIISAAFTDDNPSVEFFSPEGYVKGIRQVTVRFSEQMVPYGDPRGSVEPFDIDCPVKGTGRWADGKNWVYDFEKDLGAGIQASFKLKSGIKTLSGKEIKGKREYSFTTGGPSIQRSDPYNNSEYIDEEQIFIVTLDAEPDKSSVLKNVFFSVEGIQDFIGIKIIEGKDRDEITGSLRYVQSTLPLILIQCKQRFPSNTKVSLTWGKNVKSASGVANFQDQVLRFKTREPFTADYFCNRENAKSDCVPMLPITLNFSAPVSKDMAQRIILKGKDGKTWKGIPESDNDDSYVRSVVFMGPFPESSDFKIELPRNFKDDTGRPLENAGDFPLTVKTDKYPPLAKFGSRFGILELNANPVLPVTLRNLEPEIKARMLQINRQGIVGKMIGKIINVPAKSESIQGWLRRVAASKREESVFDRNASTKDFKIPKPSGKGDMEVVGIPMKDPGLYIVEIESVLLGESLFGKPAPFYVPAAVLVTNLSVHFKWGRESSLVWVTALDTGDPIKDAAVAIKDCGEKVLWQGKTDDNGIAKIEGGIPSADNLPTCNYNIDYDNYEQLSALRSLGGGLFITAEAGGDMSFVHSSWDEGIEPWRFQLPQSYSGDSSIVATIFDRTLLRAGETVHMKHLIRRHAIRGFSLPSKEDLPDTIYIEHSGSGDKYELPLSWSPNGVAENTFSIPRDAKLGTYEVIFTGKGQNTSARRRRFSQMSGGNFRVEEFRVPLLKAIIKPPAEPLINAKEAAVDMSVQYLAGGGAGQMQVKLRSNIIPKHIAFAGYEDFVIGNGAVREGITRSGHYYDEEYAENVSGAQGKISTMSLTLDKAGGGRAFIADIPKAETPAEINAELEFRDPNGEIQTVSSKIPLWPSKYLVGIKPDSWAVSKENFKFHTIVLDTAGKVVANAPVKVYLYTKNTYTHRKRLVGGFYAYEYVTEIKKAATLCEGRTDAKGLLICEVKSPVSGNVILQAESIDSAGNMTIANREVWVAGKGDWWFEVQDNDRIDLLPEKKMYEQGETAVFQVRMPFRSATALITVEREGVMETWVKKLSGKQPVIEVPVKGTYAPNCFVSALVVRGRVSGVQPTAMVDMGRPAYKLGISEIKVGWKLHQLKVSVVPDRRIYKTRDRAKVRIKVTTSAGSVPPAGSEVAVAAIDEGLLELAPNRSWDILSAMMGQRAYEVRTASAQMQVIGRRHFGLKALPQGGGGGRQTTRELFDTLLLWKGRVVLDKKGEAFVEIPLNDSITSFRIAVIANGSNWLFGTGYASIQSTQDLMILSGLPPLVREGDEFIAGFTLRNTTNRVMELDAAAKVDGITAPLPAISLKLDPGEAKEIGWNAVVPFGSEKLVWEAEVKEKNESRKDGIKIIQKVVPSVPVRTIQSTISQVQNDKDINLSVEKPRDAVPGRGGIKVLLKPKISGSLSGVTDYMKTYPYTCMEQKVSIAVSLGSESMWQKTMSELPSYFDSDGLVKYFPTMDWGSPVLTSYIIAIGDESGRFIPADLKERMSEGLNKFVNGSITRYSPLASADLTIKKLAAIEALSRNGNAHAKILGSVSIDPNLWPTSAVIDWFNILLNIKDIPKREDRINEVLHILRSRLNFQGTKMSFSTESSDYLWWLMVSNDVNSVRLILSLVNSGKWKEDMPRIVLGALSRQHRGSWDLTVANAWGVVAMEKFSRAFESVTVDGVTRVVLSGQTQTTDWKTPGGKTSFFAWPQKKDELSLSHQGDGSPWVTIQSTAAIPLKEALGSGFKIKKTIAPVEQKNAGKWSTGDIFRIKLEIEAQADQTWVVVSDPVPAGSTILGKGFERDSAILTGGEEKKGWVWTAFEERTFEAYRVYYEYVPKGKWSVEYTIRLNQSGKFQMPSSRVEALYFPEMFGEIPNKMIEVGQ